MDDNIGARVLYKPRERDVIFQHDLMGLEVIGRQQSCMACALQRRIIIIRHAIKADDLMTFRQQPAAEMKANETGGTRDENAHEKRPLR